MNEKYPCNDVGSVVMFLIVLGCFCWLLSITGCGSSSPHNTDTARTMDQLERENQSARSEIENSERHIERAETSVTRAIDAVSRSEAAAIENARSVDQLQTLVAECQGIIEAEQRIIREVDKSNGAGEEKDQAH